MLPKPTIELLCEIAAHFGPDRERKARKDPDAYLFSLLTLIKQELPHVYATLYQSIELATYDGYLKEARQKLTEAS